MSKNETEKLKERFVQFKKMARGRGGICLEVALEAYREIHGIKTWTYYLTGVGGSGMFAAHPFIGGRRLDRGSVYRWHK